MLSLPWAVISRGPGPQELTIGFVDGDGGACTKATSVNIRMIGSDVRVEVLGVNVKPSPQACPARLNLGHFTVDVGVDLAGRRLRHGPVSPVERHGTRVVLTDQL